MPDAGDATAEASPEKPDAAPESDSGRPEAAGEAPLFGEGCLIDADCHGGLRCLRTDGDDLLSVDLLDGGPAGGICSRSCLFADECADGENDATCARPFGIGPTYCLPTCTLGPTNEPKCLGRSDLACQAASAGFADGVCVPNCGSDLECGDRVCHLGTGLCTDFLYDGKGMGEPCEDDFECETGVCLYAGNAPDGSRLSVCSGFCNVGSIGCGIDPTSPEPLDAMCLLAVSDPVGVGDLGYCVQLCDCNDDCRHSGFACDAFDPASIIVTSARGRRGACTPFEDALAPIPCGNDGGVDAATPEGGTGSEPPPEAGVNDAGPTTSDAAAPVDAARLDAAAD